MSAVAVSDAVDVDVELRLGRVISATPVVVTVPSNRLFKLGRFTRVLTPLCAAADILGRIKSSACSPELLCPLAIDNIRGSVRYAVPSP
jgi:hypothetical protein